MEYHRTFTNYMSLLTNHRFIGMTCLPIMSIILQHGELFNCQWRLRKVLRIGVPYATIQVASVIAMKRIQAKREGLAYSVFPKPTKENVTYSCVTRIFKRYKKRTTKLHQWTEYPVSSSKAQSERGFSQLMHL